MDGELTQQADMALRAIINGLRGANHITGHTLDYRQGQIDLIRVFMEPTSALLDEADAELRAYAKKVNEAEEQRLRELLTQSAAARAGVQTAGVPA